MAQDIYLSEGKLVGPEGHIDVSALAENGTYLPYSVMVAAQQREQSRNNATTLAADSAAIYGIYRILPDIQNTYAEWEVLLAAGTYTLTMAHRQGPDRGIYTVSIDGVDIGTVDGYAAAGANSIATITGLAIAAGRRKVRLTMATKNASSTGYTGYFNGIALGRTGA